jgi:hypothetical protein
MSRPRSNRRCRPPRAAALRGRHQSRFAPGLKDACSRPGGRVAHSGSAAALARSHAASRRSGVLRRTRSRNPSRPAIGAIVGSQAEGSATASTRATSCTSNDPVPPVSTPTANMGAILGAGHGHVSRRRYSRSRRSREAARKAAD